MPTLATTAMDSQALPSRSPNRSTRYSPMAPDTTANEKIVLAKSYRAHEAGTMALPLGVIAASPRAPTGDRSDPRGWAALDTGR